MADIDYTELAECIYGQPYSSDVARRMFYGSRRTLELIDAERNAGVNDTGVLSELDAKTIELRKERQRLQDQRREYNKLLSSDGRKEHLYESLMDSAGTLPETIGSVFEGSTIERLTFADSEAVLILSDWHYGMTTNNAFNTYNTQICRERVKKVVSSTIERILINECRRLHIIVLGDLFHGAIHVGARVASEELVCDQIMQVSEILAQSIFELSKYVEETSVYVTYGNHARTVQSKEDSVHRDNMERLVPWWLEQRIKAEENYLGRPIHVNVVPESDTEFLYLDVCGHGICATHGDLDSVRTSPRLLTTLFHKKYGKDIEYILLGDKHHCESFDELGVTAMLCGSLCGADDYANSKRLFSAPSQLLLIINEDNGVDAEYRLKC